MLTEAASTGKGKILGSGVEYFDQEPSFAKKSGLWFPSQYICLKHMDKDRVFEELA